MPCECCVNCPDWTHGKQAWKDYYEYVNSKGTCKCKSSIQN